MKTMEGSLSTGEGSEFKQDDGLPPVRGMDSSIPLEKVGPFC